MKKTFLVLVSILFVFLFSCEDDNCKDCWIRTFDENGNIEAEGEKSIYCEDDLYEKETSDTTEIGGRKAIWICE